MDEKELERRWKEDIRKQEEPAVADSFIDALDKFQGTQHIVDSGTQIHQDIDQAMIRQERRNELRTIEIRDYLDTLTQEDRRDELREEVNNINRNVTVNQLRGYLGNLDIPHIDNWEWGTDG